MDYDLCDSQTPIEQWWVDLSYSLESVPIFSGYVHLVFANGVIARIDIGSRFGDNKDRMEAGVAYGRSEFGEITIW